MKNYKFLQRSLIFTIGLFIMAMGVALSVKANLGVSPISCVPYVFSLESPLTLGQTTIIFSAVLILMQMVLLRRQYQLFQLIQLPISIAFGVFIDFTMYLISWVEPAHYFAQAFVCLLGCVVIAFGVFLEVKAAITYLPGEGLAMAITRVFKIEFGKSKIGVDSSFVLFGIICSFVFLYSLAGIREGTIVAALVVGYIVKFISSKIHVLDKLVSEEKTEVVPAVASNNLIITISREFGSGGHEIGKAVAKRLGVKFYDKKLIKLTSEKSHLAKQYVEQHEQKLAYSLLYQLYEQNYAYINERKPPLDMIFLVQSKIIRDISLKESCVIVGRCANFILKDQPGVFNVFIHANKEFRVKRVADEFGFDTETALHQIDHTNKERANYCKHYTGKDRDDVRNYHITVDSSIFGVKHAVDLILGAVNEYQHSLAVKLEQSETVKS